MALSDADLDLVIARLKKGVALADYPGSRVSLTITFADGVFAWETFDEGDERRGTYAGEAEARAALAGFPRKAFDRILGPGA